MSLQPNRASTLHRPKPSAATSAPRPRRHAPARLERTIIGRSLVLLLRALEGLEFDFGKGCADRTDLLDLSNLDKSQCGVTDCIFSGWRVSAEGERRARRSCGTHVISPFGRAGLSRRERTRVRASV